MKRWLVNVFCFLFFISISSTTLAENVTSYYTPSYEVGQLKMVRFLNYDKSLSLLKIYDSLDNELYKIELGNDINIIPVNFRDGKTDLVCYLVAGSGAFLNDFSIIGLDSNNHLTTLIGGAHSANLLVNKLGSGDSVTINNDTKIIVLSGKYGKEIISVSNNGYSSADYIDDYQKGKYSYTLKEYQKDSEDNFMKGIKDYNRKFFSLMDTLNDFFVNDSSYNKSLVDAQNSTNMLIDQFLNSNLQVPNTTPARKIVFEDLLRNQKAGLGNYKNFLYYKIKYIESQNEFDRGNSIFYFNEFIKNAQDLKSDFDKINNRW